MAPAFWFGSWAHVCNVSIVAWFWNSGYGRTFCLLAIAVCGIYARAVNMKEFDLDLSESLRFFLTSRVCVLLRLELALLRRWPNVSRTASAQDVSQLHARALLGNAPISVSRGSFHSNFPIILKSLNQKGADVEMCVIEAVDVESRRFDQLWCRYWEMFEGMFLLATRPRDGRQRACNPRMV